MGGIFPSGVIAAAGGGADIWEATLFAQVYFTVGYFNQGAAFPGVTIANEIYYGTLTDIWAWDGVALTQLTWTTNTLTVGLAGQDWAADSIKEVSVTLLSTGEKRTQSTFTVTSEASTTGPGWTKFNGIGFNNIGFLANENYKVEIVRNPDSIHYEQMMNRARPLVFSNHLCVAFSPTIIYDRNQALGSMNPNVQAGANMLLLSTAGSTNWQWQRQGYTGAQAATCNQLEFIIGNVGNGYAAPNFMLPSCTGPVNSDLGNDFQLFTKRSGFTWVAGATMTVRMWRNT